MKKGRCAAGMKMKAVPKNRGVKKPDKSEMAKQVAKKAPKAPAAKGKVQSY